MKLTRFISDDDAVSPVIGVILMVAITVILAAVIGTFVLDLGQNAASQQASAGVSVDGSQATLTSLGPSTAGIKCSNVTTPNGIDWDKNASTTSNVGESIACGNQNAVVAVGDGSGVQNASIHTFDN